MPLTRRAGFPRRSETRSFTVRNTVAPSGRHADPTPRHLPLQPPSTGDCFVQALAPCTRPIAAALGPGREAAASRSAVVVDDLDVVPVGVQHERAVVARV